MRLKKNLVTNLLSNRVYFLLAFLVVVLVVLSLLSPYFLDINTILEITRFGAVLAIVAIGQSLIILAGGAGIDLSVGAMVSLTGVVLGFLAKERHGDLAGRPWAVLAGLLLGSINGAIVAWWGVPPLIGTLSTMWIYGAIALVSTRESRSPAFPQLPISGAGQVLGIPAQLLVVVVPLYVVLQFLLSKTVFGRWIYMIGVNSVAARFPGIPVVRVRFSLYALSGLLAGLAAVIMSSWLMAARPDVGNGLELQSITVAVLGGINIFGGTGSLAGAMLAVLIVTLIASGLQLGNINTIWQLAVLGMILLAAVALNQAISLRMSRRQGM